MKQDDFRMNDDFTDVFSTPTHMYSTVNHCVCACVTFFLIKRTIIDIESPFKAIANVIFSQLNNCHNACKMTQKVYLWMKEV